MKNLKYIILAISLCLATACSKTDSITNDDTDIMFAPLNQSVSGSAMIDQDGDGIGDIPLRGAKIYLGPIDLLPDVIGHELDSIVDIPGNELYENIICTYTDGNGDYIFESIPTFQSYGLALYTTEFTETNLGKDVTPDGDGGEETESKYINITLLTDEQDDGNNFVVTLKKRTASISGYVMIDNDQDGILDGPQTNVTISLAKANPDGNPDVGTLNMLVTSTDINGFYSFDNLVAAEYVVVFNDVEQYIWISSGDDSPDTDIVLDPARKWIPAAVIDDEIDEDNNFSVGRQSSSASGNIQEDTDGDGIGDIPAPNLRVELYARNADGVPVMPLIAEAYSDNSGYFNFRDLPSGEYVMYYIGAFGFECIKGEDQTPEAGEPLQGPEPFFIPMNVEDPDVEDFDNVFTVKVI